MNKHKEKQRVAHGKPAKIIDTSMHKVYRAAPDDEVAAGYRLGDQAFMDLTDVQNDEVGALCCSNWQYAEPEFQFVYSYWAAHQMEWVHENHPQTVSRKSFKIDRTP
jgi:hypothetical protein